MSISSATTHRLVPGEASPSACVQPNTPPSTATTTCCAYKPRVTVIDTSSKEAFCLACVKERLDPFIFHQEKQGMLKERVRTERENNALPFIEEVYPLFQTHFPHTPFSEYTATLLKTYRVYALRKMHERYAAPCAGNPTLPPELTCGLPPQECKQHCKAVAKALLAALSYDFRTLPFEKIPSYAVIEKESFGSLMQLYRTECAHFAHVLLIRHVNELKAPRNRRSEAVPPLYPNTIPSPEDLIEDACSQALVQFPLGNTDMIEVEACLLPLAQRWHSLLCVLIPAKRWIEKTVDALREEERTWKASRPNDAFSVPTEGQLLASLVTHLSSLPAFSRFSPLEESIAKEQLSRLSLMRDIWFRERRTHLFRQLDAKEPLVRQYMKTSASGENADLGEVMLRKAREELVQGLSDLSTEIAETHKELPTSTTESSSMQNQEEKEALGLLKEELVKNLFIYLDAELEQFGGGVGPSALLRRAMACDEPREFNLSEASIVRSPPPSFSNNGRATSPSIICNPPSLFPCGSPASPPSPTSTEPPSPEEEPGLSHAKENTLYLGSMHGELVTRDPSSPNTILLTFSSQEDLPFPSLPSNDTGTIPTTSPRSKQQGDTEPLSPRLSRHKALDPLPITEFTKTAVSSRPGPSLSPGKGSTLNASSPCRERSTPTPQQAQQGRAAVIQRLFSALRGLPQAHSSSQSGSFSGSLPSCPIQDSEHQPDQTNPRLPPAAALSHPYSVSPQRHDLNSSQPPSATPVHKTRVHKLFSSAPSFITKDTNGNDSPRVPESGIPPLPH